MDQPVAAVKGPIVLDEDHEKGTLTFVARDAYLVMPESLFRGKFEPMDTIRVHYPPVVGRITNIREDR